MNVDEDLLKPKVPSLFELVASTIGDKGSCSEDISEDCFSISSFTKDFKGATMLAKYYGRKLIMMCFFFLEQLKLLNFFSL